MNNSNKIYDLVVIGAGSGGVRAARISASYGAKVAVITAKEKLRKLLGKNLSKAICFSSEKADKANLKDNRIENVLDLVKNPYQRSTVRIYLNLFSQQQ